jgi:hypothetical protein
MACKPDCQICAALREFFKIDQTCAIDADSVVHNFIIGDESQENSMNANERKITVKRSNSQESWGDFIQPSKQKIKAGDCSPAPFLLHRNLHRL